MRPPDLRAFLAAEAEPRPAVGRRTRTVAALKVFFRFSSRTSTSSATRRSSCGAPKKREALPDLLDRRELGRLLAVVDRPGVGHI